MGGGLLVTAGGLLMERSLSPSLSSLSIMENAFSRRYR